ncbi:hypothetical protein AVP1_0001 [Aeromonas phage AVP1]|nr:hypothetical protein AVP1_0001 [Aeromonas phage AVP1]
MNVNIDNLEHVFDTLNGFESLSNGDLTSPDSVYAKTVLKLNGVDFKGREGSESFVSSVKAGAQKVYEMIKNFIKAIRDFFFGSKTKVSNDIKITENNTKELDTLIFGIPKSEYDVFKAKVSEIKFEGEPLFNIGMELDTYVTGLNGWEGGVEKRGFTSPTLSVAKLLNVPNIDFHHVTKVGLLGKEVTNTLSKIEANTFFTMNVEALTKIKSDIKKILPASAKFNEEGTKTLEHWTKFLEKCNEDCKGRTVSNEEWKREFNVRYDILTSITVSKELIRELKHCLDYNAKLVEKMKNMTGRWKKYLEQ